MLPLTSSPNPWADDLSLRVKTKVQQRALAGERYRGVIETLTRLIRGEFIVLPFIVILKTSYPPVFHPYPRVSIMGEMLNSVLSFLLQVPTRKTRERCWRVSADCTGGWVSALFGASLRTGYYGRSLTSCRTTSIASRSVDSFGDGFAVTVSHTHVCLEQIRPGG